MLSSSVLFFYSSQFPGLALSLLMLSSSVLFFSNAWRSPSACSLLLNFLGKPLGLSFPVALAQIPGQASPLSRSNAWRSLSLRMSVLPAARLLFWNQPGPSRERSISIFSLRAVSSTCWPGSPFSRGYILPSGCLCIFSLRAVSVYSSFSGGILYWFSSTSWPGSIQLSRAVYSIGSLLLSPVGIWIWMSKRG